MASDDFLGGSLQRKALTVLYGQGSGIFLFDDQGPGG